LNDITDPSIDKIKKSILSKAEKRKKKISEIVRKYKPVIVFREGRRKYSEIELKVDLMGK
jgi:hypothetical protein